MLLIYHARSKLRGTNPKKRLDVGTRVADLEAQVKALQDKIGTLNLPGTCYFKNKWYNAGQEVEGGGGTCKENGVVDFPKAY